MRQIFVVLGSFVAVSCAPRTYNAAGTAASNPQAYDKVFWPVRKSLDLNKSRWNQQKIDSLIKSGMSQKDLDQLSALPPFDYELPAQTEGLGASIKFANKLSEVAKSQAISQMSISDFLLILPTTSAEDTEILNARGGPVYVKCNSEKHCLAYQRGSELKIKLSEIEIPVLGHPSLAMEEEVNMQFRVIQNKTQKEENIIIELCSIEGISIKKGFYMALDGVYSKLNLNTATGKKVATTSIDIGPGGSYPTDDCRL